MNEPDDETSLKDKGQEAQKSTGVDNHAGFNDDGELVHYPLPQQPKKSRKALWILLVILVVLMGGAAAAYWRYKHRYTKAVDHVIYGSSEATGLKQLCFLRLSYLVCTDVAGNGRVRYDLPAAPSGTQFTSLNVSADQSTFIAFADNYAGAAPTQSQVVVLNNALASPKQLTFPNGLTPSGRPTLSADGKTAYLELDGQNNSRQVYSYDIASGKATQLTSNDSNSLPQMTKDGHVIFSKFVTGSDGWQPYVMDGDGKNQKPLMQGTTVFKPFGFSYDYSSDTVYIFGDLASNPQILYGTVSDFMAGKAPGVIHANADDSAFSIARISSSQILINKQNQGVIIDVATGKQVGMIDHYGTQVGWLDVSKLTRSSQQTEQPYERIISLATMPDDFQTFIKQTFDQQDALCKGAPDGAQYGIIVRQVVRESFAQTVQHCDNGSTYYYAKVNGVWTKAFSTQEGVECTLVNQYKFTKDIITQCFDANNQLVANTNP